MINFQTILYPVDLDAENVSSAVDAFEFAQMFKSKIHVLYVNDIMAGYRKPADHEDAVALRVKKEVPGHLLEDLDIVYAVSKGEPAKEILKYARDNKINLIIIGRKHHGKVYTSLFDSTDVNVIDEAFLPILVIPEKENSGR